MSFDEIYKERDRYDLHWAFKYTNTKMKAVFDEEFRNIVQEHLKMRVILDKTNRDIQKRIKRFLRFFNFFSQFLLFLDIVVSVLLILLVTIVSQRIEGAIESIILNIIFIGIIALGKVLLDRFLVVPRIDEWGWSRYLKAIEYVKEETAKVLTCKFVLCGALDKAEDPDERFQIFHRAINSLTKKQYVAKERLLEILCENTG